MRWIQTPFVLALLTLAIVCGLLVTAGIWRYGNSEGLVRRVQVEMEHWTPHENMLPTPLPRRVNVRNLQDVSFAHQKKTPLAQVTSADEVILLPTITPVPLTRTNESKNLPVATATALPSPTPTYQSPLPAVELTGLRHEWQTWNNCGPATLSFYLSYFGSRLTQADTGSQLRHHPDDKNVLPEELAEFARQQGYLATVRVNGDNNLLRTFLSNGIPVIIETWLEEEPNDGMGHYRLLTGYNDAEQSWIAYDSYITRTLINPEGPYRGIRLPYGETDALWRVFNRVYLLVYPSEKEELVRSIFGESLSDPVKSEAAALERAKNEIAINPNDPYAWFNLGSMQMSFNNPIEAATAFDRARTIGLPWRMLWYQFEPFEAYYATGRYEEIIALTDATMRNVKSIEELYYWKGNALAALGNPNAARKQWQLALTYNPEYQPAQNALKQ
ncbi:MAG: C39 family peptidase [Caldilineaceae bacterium]